MNVKKCLCLCVLFSFVSLLLIPLQAQEMKKGKFTKIELKDKPLVLVASQQYDFEKLEIKAEWKEKGTGNYFDKDTGLDWLQNTSFLSTQDWSGLDLRDSGWLVKDGAFERKFEAKYNQKILQPDRAGSPAEWMKGDVVVKLDVLDDQANVVSFLWFRFNPDDTLQTAEEIKREVKYEIKGVSDTTNVLGTATETHVEGKFENKKPVQKFQAPNQTGNYLFRATFFQADSTTVIGSGSAPFKVLSEGDIQATTGLQVQIQLDQQNYEPGATVTATVSLSDLAGNPITNIHDDFIKKLEFWMSGPSKDYQALVQEDKVVNEMVWTVADSTLPYTFQFTLPGNVKFGTYSLAAWAERLWDLGFEYTKRSDFTVGSVTTEPQVKCVNCHVSGIIPKFEMGTDVGTTCLTCHTDQFGAGGGPWNLFGHKKHFEKGIQVRSCSSCHTFDVATEAAYAPCTSCHGQKVDNVLIAPEPPVWHNSTLDCSNSSCHGPGAALSPDVVHERGEILAISDVPNDQGKKVEVLWRKFPAESDVNNAVVKYAVWRKSESVIAGEQTVKAKGNLTNIAGLTIGSDIVMVNGTAWDLAGEVPAAGIESYGAIVPTLFDSTIVDGQHLAVFFVSGHTEFGNLIYKTEPDSGYSVDNLAPGVPTSIAAQETESSIVLSWDKSADEDVNYYSIYRSMTPGVQLTEGNRIATVSQNSFEDVLSDIGTTFYYRITATDFSGNEGNASIEVSLLITGVDENVSDGNPESYELAQNYPNPFNPSTTINFSVKSAGHVQLIIFNTLGEEVMKVIDKKMDPGYHRVVIDAHNLSAGIYFYKIKVNDFSEVKKMLLVK